MALDTPPVAVEVVEAVVASRADIHQRLHLVRRRLLHLAILQQRSPPSTHCRPISSLLTTEVAGQFMAGPRFPLNCQRSQMQLKSRILSVGEGFFV